MNLTRKLFCFYLSFLGWSNAATSINSVKRPKRFQIVSGALVGKKLTDFGADNIRVELVCGTNKVDYFFQNVVEADILDKWDPKTRTRAVGGGKILKPFKFKDDYLVKEIKLKPASDVLDLTKMTEE